MRNKINIGLKFLALLDKFGQKKVKRINKLNISYVEFVIFLDHFT